MKDPGSGKIKIIVESVPPEDPMEETCPPDPATGASPKKKKFSRYREWVPGEKYLVPIEELHRRFDLAIKRNDFIYAQLLSDMIDLRLGNVENREATEVTLHYRNASYNGI